MKSNKKYGYKTNMNSLASSNNNKNTNCEEKEIDNNDDNQQTNQKMSTLTPSQVLEKWKPYFPDAKIMVQLPQTVLISHSFNQNQLGVPFMVMKMNGIAFDHPMLTTAKFGYQQLPGKNGTIGNWYQTMLPEAEGNAELNEPSALEAYTRALQQNGLYVQGDNYHWKGIEPKHLAVHHSAINMDPIEFTRRTFAALEVYSFQVLKNQKVQTINQIHKCPNPLCNCELGKCKCSLPCRCNGYIGSAIVSSNGNNINNNSNNNTNNNMTVNFSVSIREQDPSDVNTLMTTLWKPAFPDAAIINFVPNQMVISHSLMNNQFNIPVVPISEHGADFTHPLLLNATYGYQQKNGILGNWYEIILPDMPGVNGGPSAVQSYTKALNVETGGLGDIYVHGDHYHWKSMFPFSIAVHHSSTNMRPANFIRHTFRALLIYAAQFTRNQTPQQSLSQTQQPLVIPNLPAGMLIIQ